MTRHGPMRAAAAVDEDDPTETEIQALEAKLAMLKEEEARQVRAQSLQDVVSKIKKPASPNKSKFLDTTGLVAARVVRDVPSSSAEAGAREERLRAMLRRPQSHVHGGDTDSSEDEDNRTPFETKYNDFGRQVKRLAHGAASSSARDRLQERAEHVNRATKREMRPKVAARRADGGRPAAPEQPHEEVMLDSFARMSVINPRLSQAELRDCMQDKQLIRISQLGSHVRGEGIPGDWVTIGVIARKSEPRTSQKGSTYSSWTLTDLIDCQKPAKVMLFGDAHGGLWKTSVGTVVALAGCKVMKEKEMDGSGITLSVNSAKHCIMLGTSPDLDFCKAKCKNGRICLSFINKRHCPVCVFHMNAEYKKTGAKRGELQGMSSVAPRRCEESLTAKKKQLSSLGLKHISQAEAKAIATVAEDSVEIGEMLLKPCAGARNLLKHLTADASAVELDDGRPGATAAALNKARAVALLRQSGGVKKANPNAVRARASGQSRQAVLERVARRVDENTPADATEVPAPPAKRPRLVDEPRFRAVLEARSSHAAALEAELSEGQEHYFQALEKKELIENKMLSTWEVKTKAVYCRKCKYRALSASDLCKSEGHGTVLVDAVKRFFSCKNCKSRTISLDKLPQLPCKNCGQEIWVKAPMGKERSGPKLDSEILSIRGNEAAFMHSHVPERNINLEF
ncbi:protein MCM10 homolog [Pollicipes pollicipes]|uniref:protein MCM10 homolog n=1 Tax=Pollicipes pollicipes TaxID=41117 RepID=UPI0018856573|nr:protein MCM10 homolog [Pollicipes pollicipes]